MKTLSPNDWLNMACEYLVGNEYEFSIRVGCKESLKFTERDREYLEKIPYIFIVQRWDTFNKNNPTGWAIKGGISWLDMNDLDFYLDFSPKNMLFKTKEEAWEAYQKWFEKEVGDLDTEKGTE